MKMIHALVNHFFLIRIAAAKPFHLFLLKKNYGKPVMRSGLFIGFCDTPVNIALRRMANSFDALQLISSFRENTRRAFSVADCRYESLHCYDRFVMK